MNFLKLDLHVHTIFSGDSLITPEALVKYAKLKNLDGFAITDHNNMRAFKQVSEATKQEDLVVIPGIEIETDIGEVIGLFLETELDFPDDNFFTIIKKIRAHGGIIVVPHPFDILRDNHLKMNLLTEKITEKYVDGIEIINARIILRDCVKKAAAYCKTHGLFETGGSDAHTPQEIGQAYTAIWNYPDLSLESIKNALLKGHCRSMGGLSSPWVHLTTVLHKLKKGSYFRELF
ncbi:MAG: PHP domain-containing protein [Promethearchaeia archaeon]